MASILIPLNAANVEVVISVLDANGNYRTNGTTTSDASGTYSPILDP